MSKRVLVALLGAVVLGGLTWLLCVMVMAALMQWFATLPPETGRTLNVALRVVFPLLLGGAGWLVWWRGRAKRVQAP
ncbi:hypothetical protein [Roseateles sp. BYS87W]|uniref:Uncharacterized protein n=1 Tax=Pelomonas baiyunensis TaxID=3299026 RepID=A0ABW7GWW3_9BURK